MYVISAVGFCYFSVWLVVRYFGVLLEMSNLLQHCATFIEESFLRNLLKTLFGQSIEMVEV